METRKKTTAGVLVWTAAPRTSSVIYEDVWEDGEQTEKEDDFVSQMDENGIIGLSGALRNVELGENCRDEDPECNSGCYAALFTSEKLHPSGCKKDTPPEEMSCLRAHLSDTELPDHNMMVSIEAQTENEAMKRKKKQRIKKKSSNGTRTDNENHRTSGHLGAANDLTKSYINKVENKTIRSLHSGGRHTPDGVSSQHCPVSQSARAVTALTLPHLLHFTPEELAAAPGIDAETFPEMDFIESIPDSCSSLKSSPRSPRKSESNEPKGHQATAICPKQLVSQTCSLKSRQSPDRDSGTHTVNTNTKATEVNNSKKGPLSYRTPDFSKVEPRVHFPKSGYKPPKSRLSSKKDFPGSPVVYKSPAEIVKEVLLEAPDQPPSASACDRPPGSSLSSTVPQDFRSWQQATTLLEQLQEDYNRLLTKYADAENTIDRLRLEAKVKLYSDLPDPSHSVQSLLCHDASGLMMLDFPQAQKAAMKSASLSNGHSSPQRDHVDKILYFQADCFLQQLQAYQDILRREKLQPAEQMKGLIQLAEGLDSLERGYLLAKDDHKRLQQQGTRVNHFDPERKLEGLIYQCGLHMDELKEQVEKMPKGQPKCEALPSPPSYSTLSCDREKTLTYPQTPPVPLLVDHEAAVEVSSASEESDQTEAEDDEIFKSFYLKPVSGSRAAKGSASVMDGNIKSNQQDHPHLYTSKQETSSFFPSSHGSNTLPVRLPSSSSRLTMGNSCSLSSLGEIPTSERRNSRHQTGGSKLLSQDGIDSPEADSGFVGSESSHLTPLAAQSPLHQRAPESEAVHHKGRTKKPPTTTSPASSPSHSHMKIEPSESSHLIPDKQMRSSQAQRRHTFSPQHWAIQTKQPRINCGNSGFGAESDSTLSASEDGQSDQFNRSITSVHSSHSSPASSMQYHRGNSLRALFSSQVVNRNDAIQSLQAEVTTLKETLESCLRNKKPRSSVRSASPAPCYTVPPHIRPGDEQQNDVSKARGQARSENVDEELRQETRRNASAHRQKAQPDKLTVSELKSSTVSPQSLMSRCTQTSAVETDNYSHTNGVYNTTPHRQQPDVSIRDRTGQASLCPQCSYHRGQSQSGGKRDGARSHCPHCLVCGRRNSYRSSKQECWRGPDSATYRSCQPAEFPDKEVRSTSVAAPPALLHCMPMCPPPILLYSSPIYASSGNRTVRGCGEPLPAEVRERNRCSLSADEQHCLDRSLNRAIRAARHMKSTSRRMAHSLATGLEYQQLLTQSCSY